MLVSREEARRVLPTRVIVDTAFWEVEGAATPDWDDSQANGDVVIYQVDNDESVEVRQLVNAATGCPAREDVQLALAGAVTRGCPSSGLASHPTPDG